MPIDDEERRALRRVIEAIGDRATPPAAFEELQLAADDQPARRPARVLVAAGVGALLLLALAAGFALSRNDDTDRVAVTQPEDSDGSAGPEPTDPTPEETTSSEDETSTSTCAENIGAARQLLDPRITFDYTAFANLDELIEQSDLVVRGVATSAA